MIATASDGLPDAVLVLIPVRMQNRLWFEASWPVLSTTLYSSWGSLIASNNLGRYLTNRFLVPV